MNDTEHELADFLLADLGWLLQESKKKAMEEEWWASVWRNLWLAREHLRFLEGDRGTEHMLHAMRRMADALALILGRA